MADGYDYAGESDFSDLDEWLCEYVDGTIDPVVREALEEYMQVNPALAAHVEQLRQTRNLLCCYGCRHQAPKSLQPSLQRRLASEMIQDSQSLFSTFSMPLVSIAALSSMVAIFLILASTSQPLPLLPSSSMRASATQNVEKQRKIDFRATPMMSLTTNKYYSHFTPPNVSARYNEHLSPMLPLLSPRDTTSSRLTPANAVISP